MRPRRALVPGLLAAGSVVAAGAAVAVSPPDLAAGGRTAVEGTDGTAVFTLGERTIRQVRYVDQGRLGYTFTLENDGWTPVTVTGLVAPDPQPRLFEVQGVTDEDGDTSFTVGPRSSTRVTVQMLMRGCETLSARAGSFVTGVDLTVETGGVERSPVSVTFPEEVRTGSAREARCARSTASSRPPG